jgi:hypothetical protein
MDQVPATAGLVGRRLRNLQQEDEGNGQNFSNEDFGNEDFNNEKAFCGARTRAVRPSA